MKQFYSVLALLCFATSPSFAQYYFSEYFDGENIYEPLIIEIDTSSQNRWQIGPPHKLIFNTASTQPNVIVTDTINPYLPDDTSSFIVKIPNYAFDFGNIIALQWMQKIDISDDGDGGLIEFSIDNGITWQNAFNNPYVYNFYGYQTNNLDTLPGGEYAFSGTDPQWRDIWLCFDYNWTNQTQLSDSMFFRFTLLSDSTFENKEGWMLDNFLAHSTFIHTVTEKEQEHYIEVYPNPANDIINIQVKKLMEFHIIESMELIDQMGRTVDSWKNIPTKFWFDTSRYKNGNYYLNVKTNLRSESIPIVIQRN